MFGCSVGRFVCWLAVAGDASVKYKVGELVVVGGWWWFVVLVVFVVLMVTLVIERVVVVALVVVAVHIILAQLAMATILVLVLT
jgi:hypothetical protein